jgi:hypothetical protein
MYRTTLILLDHIRSPLKLLGEGFDYERRGLERSRQADPQDPMAQKRHQMSMMRTTAKPDDEHHWRWNGKGWYTRPDWNNGRCPPNSEPTDHNSCLPMKGHRDYNPLDHAQYKKALEITSNQYGGYSHRLHTGPGPDDFTSFRRHHNRPNHSIDSGSADSVDWDHKDGSQISWDADLSMRRLGFARGRPLPSDPAHLPFMNPVRSRSKVLPDTKGELRKHYVKQGFDTDYVNQNIGIRSGSYGLTPPPE